MSDQTRLAALATVIRRVQELVLLEVARTESEAAAVSSSVVKAGEEYYRARALAVVSGIETGMSEYRRLAGLLPENGRRKA